MSDANISIDFMTFVPDDIQVFQLLRLVYGGTAKPGEVLP